MRKNLCIVFTVFLALSVLSCTKETDLEAEGRQITISATLSESLTKVSFTPETDDSGKPKLSLAWEEGDQLRVYNHQNHAEYQDFTLDPKCAGSKAGTFTGTVIQADSYDIEVFNPSLNFAQQTQPRDGSAADLKYIASVEDVSDCTDILFDSISGALLVRAKMPSTEVVSAIQSIDLTASEAIFFDNGTNEGKQLRIVLAEAADTGADGILDVYAYLPVGSKAIPDGTTLLLRFNAPGTSHTVYSRYLELGSGLQLKSGSLNSIKVNCSETAAHAGDIASSGTVSSPYLIADKYQMQALHSLVAAGEKKFFKLVDDVDMEGDTWVPLNSGGTEYVNFNGNGHTLSAFTVSGTTSPSGLFSIFNGQVYDLTIDGASVTATTGAIGILAGDLGSGGSENVSAEHVRITNCVVGDNNYNGVPGSLAGNIRRSGTVVKEVMVSDCSVTSKNNYVGGLIGYVRAASTIQECKVSGSTVSGKDITGGLFGSLGSGSNAPACSFCFVEDTSVHGSYRRVGGLAGWHQAGTISCCGVEADVTVTSSSYDVGGITGIQDAAASLEHAYTRATISGSDNVGGLAGRLSGSITGCYSVCNASSSALVGGLAGLVNSGASISKCIAWNASTGLCGTNNGSVADCYGQAASDPGTVSSHAQESPRSWSAAIWDFSTAFPTLRGSEPADPGQDTNTYHLIPYPASLTPAEGHFNVSGAAVYYDAEFGGTGADVVDQFAARIGVSRSSTSGVGEDAGFNFLKDSSLGEEAYTLVVTPNKVVVKAAARTGLFYAVQTLKQLMPAAVYGSADVTSAWTIPAVEIEDAPRFGYRGFILDVCRHFFTVDEVKKYLDLMAMHKMNRFHWVLTNDQGWRLPVPAYPNLITIGAYREASPAYPGSSRDNGFYTREQLEEIVQYAANHCITVVPEFDIPGHTIAALASYPELGCTGSGYSVWTAAGTSPDVLCLGKLSPDFSFVKAVLDEIMDIFPSEYIHIGGDEVPSTVKWKTCTDCLGLIENLGIGTEYSATEMEGMGYSKIAVTKATRLQYYFMKQMRNYLASKGRKMIGWQECINDEYDLDHTDAWSFGGGVIESWTSASRGIFAAKKGIDVIMAPTWGCYFDIRQTDTAGEPGDGPNNGGSNSNGGRKVTLTNAYDWNPHSSIPAANQTYVKGVECAMWTEYISTTSQLEYMLLPRLAATSEVGWTPQAGKDFSRFTTALTARQFDIYDTLGYNYRRVYE